MGRRWTEEIGCLMSIPKELYTWTQLKPSHSSELADSHNVLPPKSCLIVYYNPWSSFLFQHPFPSYFSVMGLITSGFESFQRALIESYYLISDSSIIIVTVANCIVIIKM